MTMFIIAAHLLYDRVVCFYEERDVKVGVILTDDRRELSRMQERHLSESLLTMENIENRPTMVHTSRTNGFLESLDRRFSMSSSACCGGRRGISARRRSSVPGAAPCGSTRWRVHIRSIDSRAACTLARCLRRSPSPRLPKSFHQSRSASRCQPLLEAKYWKPRLQDNCRIRIAV